MRRLTGFFTAAILLVGSFAGVVASPAAQAASRLAAGKPVSKKNSVPLRSLVPIHRSSPSQVRRADVPTTGAVVPGFDSFSLPGNDDGSTSAVPLPFAFSFFGKTYTSVYVNNNGNLTFGQPLSTYTPSDLAQLTVPMIAPFWADVDTRIGNTVTYGSGTVNGQPAFGVNWPGVGCFSETDTVTNNFQVLIIKTSTGFNIEFNYDSITWDSGQASGGNGQCLDGVSARAGYTNGKGVSYEIEGSGLDGAFLDSNSRGLVHRSLNSSVPGRYVFNVSNGIPGGPGYVALGDSYSSGKGTGKYYDNSNGCSRGRGAWPYQLASLFPSVPRLYSSGFFACSGATTADIFTNQIPDLQSWVNQNGPPGLVTVTVGGDNLDFAGVLSSCWNEGWLTSGAACSSALLGIQEFLDTDGYTNELAETYQAIKQTAGTGNVVAVGYPNIMPGPSLLNDYSVADQCRWLGYSTPFALYQFQIIENKMNADEERAAAEAGIRFVSIANALKNHELCTHGSWVNSLFYHVNGGIYESGHPLAVGQAAMACAVAQRLGYEAATVPAQCQGITASPNRPARPRAAASPRAPTLPGASRLPRAPRRQLRHRVNQGTLTVQAIAPAASQVGAPYTGFLVADGGTGPYTWSVSSGTLPPGVSLDPDTGVISGSPTAAGDFQFDVQATDSSSPALTGTASVSVSVSAAGTLAVTTSSLPDATDGIYYTTTPSATGGIGPYTWAVSSGSLPAGLQLDPNSGTISGTTTATGPASFTLSVTDSSPGGGTTVSQQVSLNVDSAGSGPTITTTSLPGATQGSSYAGQLTAAGGTSPTSWSVVSGSLPAGLTLDPAAGTIAGAPTSTGTSSFTIQYSTGLAPNAQTTTATFQLQVTAAGAPTVPAQQFPEATVGTPFSGPLAATGGVAPYTWSRVSGKLPPGLTLDAAAGVISGTPTKAGTFSFVVKAKDSATPTSQTATQSETITVGAGAPPPSMSLSDTVQDTYVGSPYSATVVASSGQYPYTYAVTSGALPPGISLDSSTGDLTGTATTTGSYPFTVTATDSTQPTPQTASLNLSITVAAAQPLTITTTTFPDAAVSSPYAQQIGVTGGVGADTFAVTAGSLPTGLTLDPATGIISGTPKSQASASFTVTVTDSASPTPGTTSQAYTLTVGPPATLSAAAVGSTEAGQSSPYQLYLVATGGKSPITWSITSGSLPAGLSLGTSTGLISGTPKASGSFPVTVQAKDSTKPTPQTASTTVTINVLPAASLAISTTDLGEATQGSVYSEQLGVSGGVPPYTWSVQSGSLPTGLALNTKTGTISGTPAQGGYFAFTIQAADKASPPDTATQSFVLPVVPSVLSLTGSLPPMTQGKAYKGALTVSGGTKPYTWSVTAGSLPPGLHLAASTGEITGTPTGSGPASFTLSVADATKPAAQTAAQAVSLTVAPAPPLTVKTSALANATQGVAYSAKLAATGGVKPYTWQITSGTLPDGLQLNTGTGVISGTPTGSGTSNFTVQVTDSATPTVSVATAALSLTVTASPLDIAAALPPAIQGKAYTATFPVLGGVSPYSWTVTAGSLPSGLTLGASTGKVTGTPTTAGQYSLTVQVTDGSTPTAQTSTLQFNLTVLPSTLQTLTVGLPQATQAKAYSASLKAAGGVAPDAWSITSGSLPAGLKLNATTGAITGKPTTTGTSQFTAQVADASQPNAQTSAVTLQITVVAATAPAPLAISTQPPGAIQGHKYSSTLAAIGGTSPYTWSVSTGTLPPGLKLAAKTGAITGTPTQTGTFTFTIRVTDTTTPTAQTATYSAAVTVTANPLAALTSALPVAAAGAAYSTTLQAGGGVPAFQWSIASGSLPAGLTLAANGAITGTPTVTGNFTLTFNVTDKSQPTSQAATTSALQLVVNSSG